MSNLSMDLLKWYQSLPSRTVDLVGDYAGAELFIIDGNSILLEVFSNDQLDLWPGFQLLHATYLVEKFLDQLHRRKCFFHVVFFENQSTVCIPDACPKEQWPRYLCARKLLVEHLRQNLTPQNSVQIHTFESYHSSDFHNYLSSVGAYFVMCHDGAAPESPKDSTVKVSLRMMINWFIRRGYNIALINNMEYRDTKVMAMILEGSASTELVEAEDLLFVSKQNDVDEKIINEIFPKIPNSPALTQREILTISTICFMFRERIVSESDAHEVRAMILHTVLLRKFRLCDRATDKAEMKVASEFFGEFFKSMLYILASPTWKKRLEQRAGICDLGDCVDGRLFHHVLRKMSDSITWRSFDEASIKADFEQFASIIHSVTDVDFSDIKEMMEEPSESNMSLDDAPRSHDTHSDQQVVSVGSTAVLPFRHHVFDPHLRPIHLEIDSDDEIIPENKSIVFKELSHWHNHKNKLHPQARQNEPADIKMRRQRRNQYFLADMLRYATSLTNTAGRILEPEKIHVTSATAKKPQKAKTLENHRVVGAAGATIAKKQTQKDEASMRAMKSTIYNIESESSLENRYQKAKQHLASLTREKRSVVEADLKMYMLHILVQIWIGCCKDKNKEASMHIPALIWNILSELKKTETNLTSDMSICVERVIKALKLPKMTLRGQGTTKLSFGFVDVRMSNLSIEMSPTTFQLTHAGPYMDRSMGSAPDSRVVDFQPDEWQRAVLDQIDAKKSLFVVAPTSAGKTFISFYAMKQVLQADDDGVLVYVAPTKALVNQIAAEIQARFSKSFKHAGKSVWAIHTRDYRINNPTGAQILVTVPHILQIMLLSPSNAKSWSPRVKRIIFDEVHCIGQADDGVVWEQLLLLAPCPIIALSATVGNPEEFKNWLGHAQEANGHELKMIKHPHRYSDLRKFVYYPPETFSFNGLAPASVRLQPLGLDDDPGMAFVHPVISLIDRSRGIPDDLSLEPRDCLLLYEAMKKHQTPEFALPKSLDLPTVAVIRKVDTIFWQEELKKVLKSWMSNPQSPFDAVLAGLRESGTKRNRLQSQVSSKGEEFTRPTKVNEENLLHTTLPLLCSLHERDALPAILFNYDRGACEDIALSIVKQLEEAESVWKQNSKAWKVKLEGWERWKKDQERRVKTESKGNKRRGRQEDGMTKEEQLREAASSEASAYASFDPDSPIEGFHFANLKKLTDQEFREYATELTYREVPEQFIDALKRGIGIHHSGMNRKYRQVCEILFRKGYLRVVIATGTLALGINMPCKTVVFSGDSVFLTALSFRQAAGRAGRRGFDVLGNVVFQGVPYSNVCRLLSSRLPDLNGHFPITTSLVLRLMILLNESGQSLYASSAVRSLLSSSRMCLGGEESRDTILHHLRFSIEYLRRNNLLSQLGQPLNFAGCISHLYYTENSSFAFHALLSNGYFHSLCKSIMENSEDVLLEMMLVMSHLFGRRYLRRSVFEAYEDAVKKSPSVVVLPPLPERAARILQAHNKSTLDIYAAYVSTFIEQHIDTADCVLPFTRMKCGGDVSAEELNAQLSMRAPVRVNSAFVALSGHGDGQWKSISELCEMVRSGVWLEKSVVPYVGIYPDESNGPLNAYLYDYFKHGNKTELIRANQIRRGDLWYVLNDFSLVLATIVTSFENLLKVSPDDPDMDIVQGGGEAHEQALEDTVLGGGEQEVRSTHHTSRPISYNRDGNTVPSIVVKKPTTKVLDSWEDDDSEEDPAHGTDVQATEEKGDTDSSPNLHGFEESSDESLVNVLKAFKMLQKRFDDSFHSFWA